MVKVNAYIAGAWGNEDWTSKTEGGVSSCEKRKSQKKKIAHSPAAAEYMLDLGHITRSVTGTINILKFHTHAYP